MFLGVDDFQKNTPFTNTEDVFKYWPKEQVLLFAAYL